MGLVWQCQMCDKFKQGFAVERVIAGSTISICMECEIENFKPTRCDDCGISVDTSTCHIMEDSASVRYYFCDFCADKRLQVAFASITCEVCGTTGASLTDDTNLCNTCADSYICCNAGYCTSPVVHFTQGHMYYPVNNSPVAIVFNGTVILGGV